MNISSTKKLFPAMLTLVLGSTLVLSGCQATKNLLGKRDNGSLDYQQSEKLAPIELPAAQETVSTTLGLSLSSRYFNSS